MGVNNKRTGSRDQRDGDRQLARFRDVHLLHPSADGRLRRLGEQPHRDLRVNSCVGQTVPPQLEMEKAFLR
jgi:hypothetical protein